MNSLNDFEAWCYGAGRGGLASGKHHQAIDAIQRYRRFVMNQKHKQYRENDEYVCSCGLRWGVGEPDPHRAQTPVDPLLDTMERPQRTP